MMATISTGQVEAPPATDMQPRRSRWRVAMNVLVVLVFFGCGGIAVFDFLNGVYLQGSLNVIWALGAGVQLGFLIAGRDFQKDLAASVVRYPRFSLFCMVVLNVLLFGGIVIWAGHFNRANDQRRAAIYQARVQAAQPVKETR